MKRLKLRFNYHDAKIVGIRIFDSDVGFMVETHRHWNLGSSAFTCLWFHNVRNLADVRSQLAPLTERTSALAHHDIIGLMRLDKTRYLVDVGGLGGVVTDCRGFTET